MNSERSRSFKFRFYTAVKHCVDASYFVLEKYTHTHTHARAHTHIQQLAHFHSTAFKNKFVLTLDCLLNR